MSFHVLRRAGTQYTDGSGAPDSFALYTSLDGFSSALIHGAIPANESDDNVFTKITADLVGVPALQSVEGKLELRIYMWASNGIGGPDVRRFFIDDVDLKGVLAKEI